RRARGGARGAGAPVPGSRGGCRGACGRARVDVRAKAARRAARDEAVVERPGRIERRRGRRGRAARVARALGRRGGARDAGDVLGEETMSANDLALLSVDGRVATITLNRPEQRNALSDDLLTALLERVSTLGRVEGVSVCVFAGAGKSFCAGMDLKAVLDVPGAPAAMLRKIAQLTHAVRALPMVTIARVQGAAIGGGCGLACVCDLGVTTPDAKLGYPEVDLGVCP